MSKVKSNKNIVFLLLIIIVIAVTSIVLFFSLQVDPVQEVLKNDQLIKILFVLEDDGKAEASMVFAYYPKSNRGAIFDILGNTGAIYSSLGRTASINDVYCEKGSTVFREEIEKIVNMTIPFIIEIDIHDFSMLNDLLGGLRVLVPYPVDIVDENNRHLLPSGSVLLDGDKMYSYLTYDSPDDSGADKQDRRQNVLIAFLSALGREQAKIFERGVFSEYAQYMRGNIKEKNVKKLLYVISNVDAERLIPQTITGSLREVDGEKLLFPYYDGQLIKDVCKQTVATLLSTGNVEHNRIYVLEIQNGTQVQGLAYNTAALLQSVGYDVLKTTNAHRNDHEKTYIINHIGDVEIAKNLGGFIHCETIVTEDVKPDNDEFEVETMVDFTLVLGKDFDGRYVR
ncbi:MAG TPA: LCP family protein [Treponemataceae bacterium]|nr:LCP family protein [Treponemataceae bacterium]